VKFKIYYHHTDCGGVVYYAKYLEFLEEARTECLARRGAPLRELANQGIFFVVGRQEIVYKFPAYYADILTIDTKIGGISRVSIEFHNEIRNQDHKLIAKARTLLVCVDKRFKAKSIPDSLRSLLEK